MRKKSKSLLCAVLAASASLITPVALAEYKLYDQDGTRLTFNADLTVAGFLNKDSWFGESESFLGENTDSWLELGFEPQISLEAPLGKGTFFGKLSAVFTDTFGDDASGLTIGADDTHDTSIEQGHIGWKVSDLFSGLEDDSFSIAIGRQDYSIGTGLLINDGGGDGGNRGGWYLGMRKAFKNSAIARIASKELLAEAFYLENQPRAGGVEGDVAGGNIEYHFGDALTLGGTYLLADANISGMDTLDVYSGRATWIPIAGFTLSGEYVYQESDEIEANGWYAQAAYEAKGLPWTPVFSYRYATFDGDDPDTATDENFRSIAYGYTDYGSWYQGEITGNYPLGNGNLTSHLLRAKMKASEKVTLNLMYYNFSLVEPSTLGTGVSSDDWGDEVDFIVDWQATDKIYVIGVAAVLFPGDAAKQWVGGDDNWLYSMLYASYAF
ncbi:MAG: alginate export family protein [Woeseiaceae bacterium]|nr:alginate export family protein [Woeseiaceae bacterium]